MTVSEAIEAKRALEADLLEMTRAKIDEFCERTGLHVDWITIRMADITMLSDPRPHMIVQQVVCSVQL